MSNEDRAASRAEARRRARLAARGDYAAPEQSAPVPEQRSEKRGFLSRMFPPAPPLPNRPDPLAGFNGSGPLRPAAERMYLLRRNPLAWIPTGLIAFVGFIASFTYTTTPIGLIGTFVLFAAIIAAGWFGWQRPPLFGLAAALLGFFIAVAIVFVSFSAQGATPDTFGLDTIGQLLIQGVYQSGLGFLGGWYGGYLRRRQTQVNAHAAPRRRRR